jgi:hypothetical protein
MDKGAKTGVRFAAICAVVRLSPPATLEIRFRIERLAMVSDRYRVLCRLLAIVAVILTTASPATAEWKEKVLYSFQGGADAGSVPAGGVVFDKQGNLYGVTSDGGSVYQLAPPTTKGGAWTESVLYVFQGNTEGDGAMPEGGLVIDSAGNLYGTTALGGTGDCVLLGILVGCGTVYELSPPTQKGGPWIETVLYSFPTAKQGYFPIGDLVFDSAGNLYGATYFGGGRGTTCDGFYKYCGAIFELSPPKTKGGKWTEKVLYGFKGVAPGAQFGDGADPNGGLVLDSKGVIYGTTYYGGNNVKGQCQGGTEGTGCGIVFALQPPTTRGGKWTKKVLHQFNGKDGSNSAAGVVFDKSGNLYGATSGGPPNGYGLVFELKKPSGDVHSWTETVLCLFNNQSNGGTPWSGLVFDGRGDLYGTASAGDEFRGGNVFRLGPPSRKAGRWSLNVLHGFTGSPDGAHPAARVVLDTAGNVYGATQWGGTGQSCQGGCGTVFEVSP